MQTITTVGLDIAKSVFQVHCVDANGNAVLRRQLKRRYVRAFFRGYRPVSWELRRAPRPIITTSGSWPHRSADAAGLCEALCQATEERCCRRGGDLRGGHQAEHEVRANQDDRATELLDASSHAAPVHPPADGDYQLDRRAPRRVRDRSADWTEWRRAAAGSCCRCRGYSASRSRAIVRCRCRHLGRSAVGRF
jgi:transposase